MTGSQERKCFNFTWIGPTINEGTVNESIPCIGPPIYSECNLNNIMLSYLCSVIN